MDCNKEEALKAKGTAEKKMLCKDFTGARKLALRAQQLCPDLENISQMLVVCDVHCSAEKRLSGNEMDWYSILQIEQTANEATIKKQYRKFALQLHPDKNKFVGAEAAFKLVSEAQIVLLDRNKRSLYDMKRMASMAQISVIHRPPQKTSWNSNVGFQNNFRTNFSGLNPQHQQPQQQGHAGFNSGPTFWTVCPFCLVKFEYYKEMIHRSLRCQKCDKPFIAYDMNVQGAQFAPSLNRKTYFQKDILNQGAGKDATGHQGNPQSDKHRTESFRKTDYTSKVASDKVTDKIRRKRAAEFSESSDTGSDSYSVTNDEDGDIHGGTDFGSLGEQPVRRSTRNRQQVSYKENLSDDDELVRSTKKAKGGASSYPSDKDGVASGNEGSKSNRQHGFTDDMKNKSAERDEDEKAKSDSTAFEPELYDYPDPDFSDFDRNRKAECFKVGQTWALYDTVNAMPRFYAQIKKVSYPGFEVRITWLEPDPEDEDEIEWVNKDLPVSCGKFILGNSEDTKDRPMFSHLVSCVMDSRKGPCKIYPKKGETWALFRNWDLKQWSNAEDAHRQYEYDFVEILSDYAKDVGISVGLLVKLKGFSCLFARKANEGKAFNIPARELFRFSHRVPSFQMTGDEREGVPKGSFELDPAALPNNLEEFGVPENIKREDGITHHEDLFSVSSSDKAHRGSNGNGAIHQV